MNKENEKKTEKEFASEIANAFAKGYNVGVETTQQIVDERRERNESWRTLYYRRTLKCNNN